MHRDLVFLTLWHRRYPAKAFLMSSKPTKRIVTKVTTSVTVPMRELLKAAGFPTDYSVTIEYEDYPNGDTSDKVVITYTQTTETEE